MDQNSPPFDRRGAYRRPLPTCPKCDDALTSVTLRTDSALYCHCRSCGEMWTLRKPKGSSTPNGDLPE
jgi:hypothetical protein